MSRLVNKLAASRWAWRVIGRLAFNRIAVVGAERLPQTGAVLFVATHRNGALDTAPYRVAVPNAMPMVSAQLHRSALGRLLFHGIPVARAKDRDRGIAGDNVEALQRCLDWLRDGGQLFVMPEGTSTLGFKHLPFQRGAARIAHAAIKAGIKVTIVPLGVHYEDPTAWQSRVEVMVGEAVQAGVSDDMPAIHRLITQGLESVGANFVDEEAQRNAEALAYAATLGTKASYALSLKHFERLPPEALAEIVEPIASLAGAARLRLHQGMPLMPVLPWPLYSIYWLALMPLVVGFSLLNAPVVAAAFIASRKLPDAPNVIAFWRMVAAVPAGIVWALLVSIALGLGQEPTLVALYWVCSLGGIAAWYRFRKLTITLWNGLFHARARPALLRAYRELMDRMSHAPIV